MQSTSDMISPTRRFVLATDGRRSAFECCATANLSSLLDVMEDAARMSSVLSLVLPVLLTVLWVGSKKHHSSYSFRISTPRPIISPHHSCVSFLLLTSIKNQQYILRDNSPTPPFSQLDPRSASGLSGTASLFPCTLHSSSTALLQARIDLTQSLRLHSANLQAHRPPVLQATRRNPKCKATCSISSSLLPHAVLLLHHSEFQRTN
jgi:hypothetical protein